VRRQADSVSHDVAEKNFHKAGAGAERRIILDPVLEKGLHTDTGHVPSEIVRKRGNIGVKSAKGVEKVGGIIGGYGC
jgi:hypothetical protein